MSTQPHVSFNDGRSIPQLGLGVWQTPDDVAVEAVSTALKTGYRHIDTAAVYKNEEGVGKGIVASGIDRGDIFLTTKVWNEDQGFDETLKAMDASLKRLGTDYVDLYLIHWPSAFRGKYIETWKAMIRLREEGKAKLDEAREALMYLCAPVKQPQGIEQHILYFCGDAANPTALNDTEPLRISFYKAVAAFVRAYADLAQNLVEAGYPAAQIKTLEQETLFYSEVRAAIKNHSGEELDIKPFEADMRHLINTYIQADPADLLGDLSELSLTELIIHTGIHDAIAKKLNEKGKLSRNAIAEGIINNVRKTIIRDQLTDPMFYAEMSKLLDVARGRPDAGAPSA